jgi:type I restriction enzyme M protein
MLSPKLRRDVFNLWTLFWSSGMTNPLTSIEQITYMLFLKQLEALDNQRVQQGRRSIYDPRPQCDLEHHEDDKQVGDSVCRGHETCKWSYIVKNPSHDLMANYVFPWLRQIDRIFEETSSTDTKNQDVGYRRLSGQMEDAYFQFPKGKPNALDNAIRAIEKLFGDRDAANGSRAEAKIRSANADLMGDIFEYLLKGIQTSGKNGQFRTPRHIIRLMVELLNPGLGDRIIDPAAGTGGFLINSLQHIVKGYTERETLLLEWDGTPHRLDFDKFPDRDKFLNGYYFTGYDNDRTMVRIGWMNMILHSIESPNMQRQDSLGQSLDKNESGAYRIILANPPFTGNVDHRDLHQTRFPVNPRKSSEPITTKSELLFVWLILDLLERDGRCAVIVPEGVLFGSTLAHRELRRRLLFDNLLEGVISLPAGVFQPYTGVKTSILIFQKYDVPPEDNQPRTDEVWFYELESDGYTLDAKRDEKPEPNDLWDLLEKWKRRKVGEEVNTNVYYQPNFWDERWVLVDSDTVKRFPAHERVQKEAGQIRNLNELFGLPANPGEATAQVQIEGKEAAQQVYERLVVQTVEAANKVTQKAAKRLLDIQFSLMNRLFREIRNELLDGEFDQFGRKALDPVQGEVAAVAREEANARLQLAATSDAQGEIEEISDNEGVIAELSAVDNLPLPKDYTEFKLQWQSDVTELMRGFARLDGYDVKLRSHEVYPQAEDPDTPRQAKSWTAPVRRFAEDPNWTFVDEKGRPLRGSHTPDGAVRPEYLRYLRQELQIFDGDGTVNSKFVDLLDPDCIEAQDLNLSAGRYKPFSLAAVEYDPPAQIIAELQELEAQIQSGLEELLAMVESAA